MHVVLYEAQVLKNGFKTCCFNEVYINANLVPIAWMTV